MPVGILARLTDTDREDMKMQGHQYIRSAFFQISIAPMSHCHQTVINLKLTHL